MVLNELSFLRDQVNEKLEKLVAVPVLGFIVLLAPLVSLEVQPNQGFDEEVYCADLDLLGLHLPSHLAESLADSLPDTNLRVEEPLLEQLSRALSELSEQALDKLDRTHNAAQRFLDDDLIIGAQVIPFKNLSHELDSAAIEIIDLPIPKFPSLVSKVKVLRDQRQPEGQILSDPLLVGIVLTTRVVAQKFAEDVVEASLLQELLRPGFLQLCGGAHPVQGAVHHRLAEKLIASLPDDGLLSFRLTGGLVEVIDDILHVSHFVLILIPKYSRPVDLSIGASVFHGQYFVISLPVGGEHADQVPDTSYQIAVFAVEEVQELIELLLIGGYSVAGHLLRREERSFDDLAVLFQVLADKGNFQVLVYLFGER